MAFLAILSFSLILLTFLTRYKTTAKPQYSHMDLLSRSPHNLMLTKLQGNGKLCIIAKLGVTDGGWILLMFLEGNVVMGRGFQ
jgi:hypothetical protein